MSQSNELSHSFNVRLSPDIVRQLKGEQELLAGRFKELRLYDSSPHIAIATKFMGVTDSEAFADALTKEFGGDAPWELEFADFRPSSTNDYIFLHPTKASRQRLLDMHERALAVTKHIGLEEQSSGRFRSFSYDPHLSIMKVGSENITAALPLVAHDFTGVRMPVMAYELTRQLDGENGFASFPVVRTLELETNA